MLGKDWLCSLPEQGPVLVVNCEDEGDELCRRLQPILTHYGARFADIANDLHIFPLVQSPSGYDPLLAVVRNGIVRPTPLYEALLAKAGEVQPICIVIDNVADVFGGNEIDRVQVRQFVGLMRQLARAANGYVIHVGASELARHHEQDRAFRLDAVAQFRCARVPICAGRATRRSGTRAPASDVRVLEFMKSNYSALAEQITLRWANGLYLPRRRRPRRKPPQPQRCRPRCSSNCSTSTCREGANVSGNRRRATMRRACSPGPRKRSWQDRQARVRRRLVAADGRG